MKLEDLPEVQFTEFDKEIIEKQVIAIYERIMGRTLADGDPVRLFILAMAYIIILFLNKIDESAKMNLLKYSKEDFLEHLGALVGVARNEAGNASTTVRFTLSEVRPTNVIIPKGTRVTSDGGALFATVELSVIKASESYVDIHCESVETGSLYNNIAAGDLNKLVDPIPYIQTVKNITETAGGADVEDDESYKQRIQSAPESFSVAGPSGAYEFWAQSASGQVGDVKVTSPKPGYVDIYVVTDKGEQAQKELLDKVYAVCNDKKIRPLTDFLTCKAPNLVSYDIDLTYYISSENESIATDITKRVNEAVANFITWQSGKMGRDINPSELIKLCVEAGAKRVDVRKPAFTVVKSGEKADNYIVELAKLNTQSVNMGGVEVE